MKILQKQYQLIKISNNLIWNDFEEKKYAIKYKNSDKLADYLASKHINWYFRDTWIDSTDEPPKDYKVVTFKYFRNNIY